MTDQSRLTVVRPGDWDPNQREFMAAISELKGKAVFLSADHPTAPVINVINRADRLVERENAHINRNAGTGFLIGVAVGSVGAVVNYAIAQNDHTDNEHYREQFALYLGGPAMLIGTALGGWACGAWSAHHVSPAALKELMALIADHNRLVGELAPVGQPTETH